MAFDSLKYQVFENMENGAFVKKLMLHFPKYFQKY